MTAFTKKTSHRLHAPHFFLWLGLLLCALSSHVGAAESVKLQLKWLHQFQFAGYYAALEKGFFAEEGLDVTLIERGNQTPVELLTNGTVEYAVADSVTFLYQLSGIGVQVVAPIFQKSPNVLITRTASNLKTPKDLIGRRITLYAHDADGLPIMLMLAEQGVMSGGFIRKTASGDYGTLPRNETDAIHGYAGNEPYLFEKNGTPVQLIRPESYGINLYGDMLITSNREQLEYPTRVDAMRRAVLKGWNYALNHKEEIAKLILNKYSQRKSFDALLHEANNIEQAINRLEIPLGYLDSGRVDYIKGLLKKHNLPSQSVSSSEYITFFHKKQNIGLILNTEEAHFLQEHPIIKVAIDPNWYPLEFIDEYGQASGISADYLNKLEQLLNIKLEAEIGISWPEALEKVRNRQLDMIAMAAPTPERLNYVSFTNPYIRAPMIIVTQDNQDYIDDISRLKGRTVLVVKGYASEDWVKTNYPEINIQQTESTLQGLELVSTGQAYALIDNLVAANFLIRNNGLSNLKISGQLPISFNLSMAARNDWPLLRGILQKGLNAISQEESDAIYNRWIKLQYSSEINYRKILPYFFGLLALLLLMAWDSLRFRRLNKKLHATNLQLQQTEIQLKQKNHALEVVSVTDRLTGVFNRMKLETELERVRTEAFLYGTPVCLVLFDLDHFKNVNDCFGHNAGDEVLRTFAGLVKNSIRKNDIFGRWGGEEFLLICPNTSLKETFGLAERIRMSLADIETLPSGKQTLSAGAAAWRPNQSLEEWLGTCDALLYQAKSCGRNRIHGDFLTPSHTSAG